MNRRTFLNTAATAVLAGQVPAEAQSTPAKRKQPNVLFFLPDQVRRCEIGCYGEGVLNTPTRNVDKFATEGTRFTQAVSTYPLCTPYRAMLQTGLLPSHTGIMMNFTNTPPTGQCMADIFNQGGYETGYIGKWHLSAGRLAGTLKSNVPPPHLDPEGEYTPPGAGRLGYQHWEAYNCVVNYLHCYYYRDTPQRIAMPKFETDTEVDLAMDFMKEQQAADKPFFLIVSPHPPHPGWTKSQTLPDDLAAIPRDLHQRPNVKGWKDQPDKDPHCYYGMMKNMDDNFGRLTAFLDEAGLAENTIVVFASDHGEMLGSHSRYDKMVPYSEAVDVPLIIRWPGHIPAGHTSDAFYTPVDHFPTLAGLCGLSSPAHLDGKDLSWAVLGTPGVDRDDVLMMNFTSNWDYPQTNTNWPEWRGVKDRRYTYVRWLDGAEEFYDNHADAYQMRNLFDGRNVPPMMDHFRDRLTTMLKEVHDDFMPGDTYALWFDEQRNVVRNGLGPVNGNHGEDAKTAPAI